MGASDVLRWIEIGGASLVSVLGAITAIVAFRHREQIIRGEKRRAEKRKGQDCPEPVRQAESRPREVVHAEPVGHV